MVFARSILLVALMGGSAFAAGNPAEAKQHFVQGAAFYQQGRYLEAVREFKAGRELAPLPDFDFNLGRAYEKLEQWDLAIEAYRRYMTAVPDSPEWSALRARVHILQDRMAEDRVTQRKAPPPAPEPRPAPAAPKPARAAVRPVAPPAPPLAPPPAPPPTPPPTPPSPIEVAPLPSREGSPGLALPLIVGGAALIGLGAGLALAITVDQDYAALVASCAPRCAVEAWQPVQARETAAGALLVLAGVAAVADIALWIWRGRHGRGDATAWLPPLAPVAAVRF
jgi:tetratricopeptide (TPR) repeat protein